MIHETAVVKSKIPSSCIIHPYVVIGEHVSLGENVVIHSFAFINDHCEIGNNVEIFHGAVIGREPKGAGALSRPLEFERKLQIAADCSIGPHAILYYDVKVGANTLIGDGASIREQCKIGSKVVIGRYVTLNYDVVIGDHTKVMDHTWLAGNMVIGQNVFISGGVLTANDNHIGANGYNDEQILGPEIEDNAKIGVGAILLPNIRIGENSIVAASSVVTKEVRPHKTVKGIPAREDK